MSDEVFPALDGLGFNIKRRREFKTMVFEGLSGAESRVGFRQYPKTIFLLNFEFLVKDQDEDQFIELMGFMLRHKGMLGSFLFEDPEDNTVTKQVIGVGNGVATDFQVVRNYGGILEPLHNINFTNAMEVDGVLMAYPDDWTRTADGLATFAIPPADGAVITWTGFYYYRVRFTADGYDFEQLVADIHSCEDVEIVGSVRNMV